MGGEAPSNGAGARRTHRAEARTAGISDAVLRVFRATATDGVSPAVAADRLAEARTTSVGRRATIRLPR